MPHCPKFLCTSRKVLDQQIIIHNHKNIRNFHCAECTYFSNYLNNFKFHQKVHQGIPANFPCPYCSKSFYLEARLRSHMLVHTDDKNFGCDECAAKFKRTDNLKAHMRIHFPADIRAVEKVQKLTKECEKCGKKFEKNWKLKRHMVVRTKDIISKAEVVAEEQVFIVLNDAKFETV
jgi:hypothetical protein